MNILLEKKHSQKHFLILAGAELFECMLWGRLTLVTMDKRSNKTKRSRVALTQRRYALGDYLVNFLSNTVIGS